MSDVPAAITPVKEILLVPGRCSISKNHKRVNLHGNGSIDAGDAQNVLNVYAEIVAGNAVQMTDAQKLASDVSGDGAVDSADAQLILLYYVQNSVSGIPTEWGELTGEISK